MRPFEKCPVCGGDLENKQVEKILRGGGNTAAMKVSAEQSYPADRLTHRFCLGLSSG